MAHGREVRLPFLSKDLIEFCFSLPDSFKLHQGWTKFIMRKSFEDILPNEICWRKEKVGFEPPQIEWLKNKDWNTIIKEAYNA
jgi:asparagine synthase (glutamine-hydrolysing)